MDLADLVPARVVTPAAALLRFAALGGLLFALEQALPAWPPSAAPIRLEPADVARLRAQWAAETGRPPAAAELAALVEQQADDERLVREALRLGLDRSDPVVRTRLVMNLRFVHGAAGDEAALLREARALGMQRHDPVVRRRLIEAMNERLAAGVRVGEADVRAYVDAHPERYGVAPRVAFRQVFLDADRRGARLEPDAAALRPRLGQDAAGDPFLLGDAFPPSSEAELARAFGPGFARALRQAPVGQWSGPLRSAYGLHYVFVQERRAAAPAEYEAVARQARYALLEEREHDAVRAALAGLRDRYPVEADPGALTLAAAP